ncbi:hypothetical protein Y032_0272g917 [Ancylostoma ceylanicum]|uniref:Uncharacterized protein n=1 Tax=Ancylostoma ceylanicum TaxID=53326 RepID=A0A016S966_9BILA|nr:hypothetical protein Y032_0272g917 [Ancylostoma ceylanicum]
MNKNVSDLNAEELERILLDEPSTSQQFASMNATLDKLMSTVTALAKNSQAQVSHLTGVMREHVNALESAPELITDSFVHGSTRTSTRANEELTQVVHAVINSERAALAQELANSDKISDDLSKLAQLVAKNMVEALDETLSQADHDDRCMRELADLLQVDSTDVVKEVKKLQAQTNNRLTSAEFQESANVTQGASSSGAQKQPVYVQLNAGEFGNVEYYTEFDPIAAAPGRCAGKHGQLRLRTNPNDQATMSFQQGKTGSVKSQTPAPSRLTSTLKQDQGWCPSIDSNMGRMFAAVALPEVEVYRDPQGKNSTTLFRGSP